jgi:putative transcriptional regulator
MYHRSGKKRKKKNHQYSPHSTLHRGGRIPVFSLRRSPLYRRMAGNLEVESKVYFTFLFFLYDDRMSDLALKNKLPELRARHKLTQDALANELDVTRQTIISIEKETYMPSLPLAIKFSKYFALPIEEIFYTI